MGMQPRTNPVLWMGIAFGASLALTAAVLAAFGADEEGTRHALQITARFSFLFFWPAYAGSALYAVLGDTFSPLKQRGREFGLAFAAAHIPHVGLVAWLVYIGAAPTYGTFVFFGIAVVFTYLLALFSVASLRQALGPIGWWLLRNIGLNYIMYAFAVDFFRYREIGKAMFWIGYLPFDVLVIAGVALCAATFLLRIARQGEVLYRREKSALGSTRVDVVSAVARKRGAGAPARRVSRPLRGDAVYHVVTWPLRAAQLPPNTAPLAENLESTMSAPIVVAAPSTADLEPSPIEPNWILAGSPQARIKKLATSADALANVVVWDCTPGRFDWHYSQDETVVVISGEVFITSEDHKQERRLGPGDMAFFPAGSSATWRVTEHIRKVAVLRRTLPFPLGEAIGASVKLLKSFKGNTSPFK